MYSRQEASRIRQEFWTAFGKYMQPVLSAEGLPINWVNYKTGARHIYFRMDAGKGAYIGIELTHPDAAMRLENYGKLVSVRNVFHQTVADDWEWREVFRDEEGIISSRVYTRLDDVHIFRKEDWPALISFFKPRIIALDQFWSEVKPVFDVWT